MIWIGTAALALLQYSLLAEAATIEKRIVNGQVAKAGDFPFIVSIRRQDGYHNCGGALLDSTTVLTAAHCLLDWYSFSVRAGTLNQTTGGVVAEVASRKIHPEYKKSDGVPNDIGILKLKTPIETSGTIGYAKLPASGFDPKAKSTALVAGWGSAKTWTSGDVQMLNKAVVPVLARQDCVKLDAKANRDSIICAAGAGPNICIYDSGGPLVDQNTGEVIGISSWIIDPPGTTIADTDVCGKVPSVFTRVSSYTTFINESLGQGKQSPDVAKGQGKQSFDMAKEMVKICGTENGKSNKYGVTAAECIREFKLCATEEAGKSKAGKVQGIGGIADCVDRKLDDRPVWP